MVRRSCFYTALMGWRRKVRSSPRWLGAGMSSRRYCRAHRAKLDEEPVAGRLDDAPAMLRNDRIGSDAMLAQDLHRARFVEPH